MINKEYENLLRDVIDNGEYKEDRTGTGTYSVFGRQLRFNLAEENFPLITTKKVHFKSVVEELGWMLRGSTNAAELNERGVTIWNEWADPATGELGPVYGHQWRHWDVSSEEGGGHIDQIEAVIESIKENPDSRRHIVSAWNVAQLSDMQLPPCHAFFQFYVRGDKLDLQLYQRSADLFLGVPFNIASYALLLTLIAYETGYTPGEFIWTGGDCHIYSNHLTQVAIQLSRAPRQFPKLWVRNDVDIFDISYKDVALIDYDPYPSIKAPVAV